MVQVSACWVREALHVEYIAERPRAHGLAHVAADLASAVEGVRHIPEGGGQAVVRPGTAPAFVAEAPCHDAWVVAVLPHHLLEGRQLLLVEVPGLVPHQDAQPIHRVVQRVAVPMEIERMA